jgi:hypothetical protein
MKILQSSNEILKHLRDAGLGAVVPADPPYVCPPPPLFWRRHFL